MVTTLRVAAATSFALAVAAFAGASPAHAASVPAAPTGVSAVAANASATVSWTAPSGVPNDYQIQYSTNSGGNWSSAVDTGSANTSFTVTGLVNGTNYIFEVRAHNTAGWGAWSSMSNDVTPAVTWPSKPINVSATPGNGKATVSWTAPADDGGAAITHYDLRGSADNGQTWSIHWSWVHSPQDISGLTNGANYIFEVQAYNSQFQTPGPWSDPSTAVTPSSSVPGTPTAVVAQHGGSHTLIVSWTEATSGMPATSYEEQHTGDGGLTWSPITAIPQSGTAITGLTNGVGYQFEIRGVANGYHSDWSAPSSFYSPVGPPSAPTGVGGTPTNGGADLTWTAPGDNGGAAIQSYDVRYSTDGNTWSNPANNGTDATAYSVTGLSGGTAYVFQVRASNGYETGDWSTTSGPVTPSAPNPTFTNSAAPSVSGNQWVGSVLTASTGTWSPTPTSFTYQWQRAGADVVGATSQTYSTTGDDLDQKLRVVVTAHKSGYTDATATSAETGPIAGAAPSLTATTLPTISGTPVVNGTLTVNPGTWSPAADSYTYEWWSYDGTDFTRLPSSASTYVVRAADIGQQIEAVVKAQKTGYSDGSADTAKTTAVVSADFTTAPNPTIPSTATAGTPLTVNEGTWDPAPDSFSYQWKADGSAITGATARSYTPTADDVGKAITVAVTAHKDGYNDTTKTSNATSPTTAAPTNADFTTAPNPTIPSTATAGTPLTASEGAWDPAPDSFSYEWKADGTPVSGGAGRTYTPTAGDVGKAITVAVTAHKDGYNDTTKTSNATSPTVAMQTQDPTPTPTPKPTPTPPTPSPGPVAGQTIYGTAKKDVIQGTAGDDIIYAKGGNDVVYGNGGNDTIIGGAGNDKLYGGDGNDTLKGGSGRDTCDGGPGTDTVNRSCERKIAIP